MQEDAATRIGVSMELTSAEALDFLNKLATDDDFRGRLETEPTSTLSAYDIDVSDPHLIEHVTLPPKADVQQILDDLGADDYAAAATRSMQFTGPVLPLVPLVVSLPHTSSRSVED